MNKFLVFIFILSVSGCVSLPKSIDSIWLNHCMRLVIPFHLLETRRSLYKGNRLLSVNSSYGKYSTDLGSVDPGTSFEIHKILHAEDGSWGRFLRVQVKLLDGHFAGTIADIPVHAPYHPREKWTKNFTLDPNALEFNEDIVVPCD